MLLCKKSVEQPGLLNPTDLYPLRELIGNGALDYAQVMISFHYINRVASLLGVRSEMLPRPVLRVNGIRKLIVYLMAILLKGMNLDSLEYDKTYQAAMNQIEPVITRSSGRKRSNEFEVFESRPKLIEYVQLLIEDRLACNRFDQEIIGKVQQIVEAALHTDPEQSTESSPMFSDPYEHFAYIGTRYPYRANLGLITALRNTGCDDIAILQLTSLIASSNAWARIYRLFDLDPKLFYL